MTLGPIIGGLGGGAGAVVTYTNATPTLQAHGGVEIGDTFNLQTIKQMFDTLNEIVEIEKDFGEEDADLNKI